jgi:hypothetical protein
VTHTFSLASIVAENGDRRDAAPLVAALTDAINGRVSAQSRAQAELRLEAGSPDLIPVGLDVAQAVARDLGHRILFVSVTGAAPVNICP